MPPVGIDVANRGVIGCCCYCTILQASVEAIVSIIEMPRIVRWNRERDRIGINYTVARAIDIRSGICAGDRRAEAAKARIVRIDDYQATWGFLHGGAGAKFG